jgi:hypothetical protein
MLKLEANDLLLVRVWHRDRAYQKETQKLGFLSSSKIRRKIFGFGKNLFGNIVLFVEVTLVSIFCEIWWTLTRDPLLGDLSSC